MKMHSNPFLPPFACLQQEKDAKGGRGGIKGGGDPVWLPILTGEVNLLPSHTSLPLKENHLSLMRRFSSIPPQG